MSQIWVRDEKGWAVFPLAAAAVSLAVHPPQALSEGIAALDSTATACIFRLKDADHERFVLSAGSESRTRVNGFPLSLGLRILDDRDEIRVGGAGTVFFSSETLSRVEPFPEERPVTHCPRCKLAIEAGAGSVRCPGCSLWHHQDGELPCWTYAESCANCQQPTALDAGFRWTPEEL